MRLLLLFFVVLGLSYTLNSQNVVVVIIDGARYSETFGDPNRLNIPELDELSKQGALLNAFYNDSTTYTSAAIPTIWCGTWTKRVDTVFNGAETQYTKSPSLFEYYRKQKEAPNTDCIYTLKYVSSLWLPSFHPQYGPDYWPLTISEGIDDNDVLENTLETMEENHPTFSVVYFADVDAGGHSGNWTTYKNAIKTADKAVGRLWEFLQSNAFYKENTVMIVTNDHGRHDNSHGGFKSHGCGCDGCRHIMFMAIGKGVKQNFSSDKYYRLPDVAVTAASILKVDPEFSTGNVIQEIFEGVSITNDVAEKQWYVSGRYVYFKGNITEPSTISVFNVEGEKLFESKLTGANVGESLKWMPNSLNTGIYLISLSNTKSVTTQKVMINSLF